MNLLFIVFGILAFLLVIGLLCYYLAKSTFKFLDEADRIENMIRSNAPVEDVIKAILALDKTNAFKQLGTRVTELAKIAEVKYNVKILKI